MRKLKGFCDERGADVVNVRRNGAVRNVGAKVEADALVLAAGRRETEVQVTALSDLSAALLGKSWALGTVPRLWCASRPGIRKHVA